MKRKDKLIAAHEAFVSEVRTAHGNYVAQFAQSMLPFMVLMLTIHTNMKAPNDERSVTMVEQALLQHAEALTKANGLSSEESALLFDGLLDKMQDTARTMFCMTDDEEDKEEAHG